MPKNCQMLNVFFLCLHFKINNETNFLFLSHEYADDDDKQHLIHKKEAIKIQKFNTYNNSHVCV